MCEIKRLNKLKALSRRVTEKVQNFDPLHFLDVRSVSNSGLTFTDLSERIDHIASCSDVVELKSTFVPSGNDLEQVLSISAANFCKQHTICPICADRLQARRKARFSDVIKEQARLVEGGKRCAYIVTYTVHDGGDLAERLEHLKESKKRFRLMGQKRYDGFSKGEWSKIRAGISTVEIKRGEGSGKWHAHAHDLIFTDKPVDYQVYDSDKKQKLRKRYGDNIPKRFLDLIALRKASFRGEEVAASKASVEWLEATGGDSMGIHFDRLQHVPKDRTVYRNGRMERVQVPHKKRMKLSRMTFEDSIFEQAKEVLKYPVKPTEHKPDDMIVIITDTYNKRFVATYGGFRNVKGDDYNDPAVADEETFVIQWDNEAGKYGDPVPGKAREIADDPEIVEARSKAGKLLGEYRRKRRAIVEQRTLYGDDLSRMLDDAKHIFRRGINSIFSVYRHSVSSRNRMAYESSIECQANCDKYNPLIALDGVWIPGITRRDMYAAIFT